MGRTSNDQRSDALNPTSQEYKDAQDNRSQQLDPQNEKYQGAPPPGAPEENDSE